MRENRRQSVRWCFLAFPVLAPFYCIYLTPDPQVSVPRGPVSRTVRIEQYGSRPFVLRSQRKRYICAEGLTLSCQHGDISFQFQAKNPSSFVVSCISPDESAQPTNICANTVPEVCAQFRKWLRDVKLIASSSTENISPNHYLGIAAAQPELERKFASLLMKVADQPSIGVKDAGTAVNMSNSMEEALCQEFAKLTEKHKSLSGEERLKRLEMSQAEYLAQVASGAPVFYGLVGQLVTLASGLRNFNNDEQRETACQHAVRTILDVVLPLANRYYFSPTAAQLGIFLAETYRSEQLHAVLEASGVCFSYRRSRRLRAWMAEAYDTRQKEREFADTIDCLLSVVADNCQKLTERTSRARADFKLQGDTVTNRCGIILRATPEEVAVTRHPNATGPFLNPAPITDAMAATVGDPSLHAELLHAIVTECLPTMTEKIQHAAPKPPFSLQQVRKELRHLKPDASKKQVLAFLAKIAPCVPPPSWLDLSSEQPLRGFLKRFRDAVRHDLNALESTPAPLSPDTRGSQAAVAPPSPDDRATMNAFKCLRDGPDSNRGASRVVSESHILCGSTRDDPRIVFPATDGSPYFKIMKKIEILREYENLPETATKPKELQEALQELDDSGMDPTLLSKYTVPILGPFHVFMNMATTVVAMFQQVLRPLATAHGFRGPYQQDYLFHGGDMHKLRDFLTIAARTIAQHLSGTQLSAEVERDLRCVLMEPDKVKNRRVAVLMQCWWYIALVLGYDSAIDVGDVDRMFAIEREFLPLCLTGNKTMYSRMIAWRALERLRSDPMVRRLMDRLQCLRLSEKPNRIAVDEAMEMQNRLCKRLLPTGASYEQWLELTKSRLFFNRAVEQLAADRGVKLHDPGRRPVVDMEADITACVEVLAKEFPVAELRLNVATEPTIFGQQFHPDLPSLRMRGFAAAEKFLELFPKGNGFRGSFAFKAYEISTDAITPTGKTDLPNQVVAGPATAAADAPIATPAPPASPATRAPAAPPAPPAPALPPAPGRLDLDLDRLRREALQVVPPPMALSNVPPQQPNAPAPPAPHSDTSRNESRPDRKRSALAPSSPSPDKRVESSRPAKQSLPNQKHNAPAPPASRSGLSLSKSSHDRKRSAPSPSPDKRGQQAMRRKGG